MIITELFDKIVSAYPRRTAIVDETCSYTYEEINKRSNQLAHYMINLGLTPNQAVGVLAYRDNNYIIAILAVLKAHCFYVPLDPKYPDDRLDFIITNAEMNFFIGASEKLKAILHNHETKKIYLDDEKISQFTISPPNLPSIDEKSNIYILFTSGSTGKPKGVVVNHRGVLNLVNYYQKTFTPPFGNFNVCQNARLSFDASTLEIWYSLLSGATLFFTPEKILLQPKNFVIGLLKKKLEKHY
ncbi:AMP-binding protein [bacterium]|nr:AMP-binding protein [bacterium]